MPLYEYRCENCAHKFQLMQSIKTRENDTACPECGQNNVRRLMSSFASQIKGDHKPGFAEMKAMDMCRERENKFAKLPPIMGARATPPPEPPPSSSDAG